MFENVTVEHVVLVESPLLSPYMIPSTRQLMLQLMMRLMRTAWLICRMFLEW